jgi:hypothetical protein
MMTTSSTRAVVGLRPLELHLPLRARLPATAGLAACPASRVTRAGFFDRRSCGGIRVPLAGTAVGFRLLA